jgi:hypothetical protein
MADPVQSLTFLAWVREQVAEQATAQAQGRASGTVIVTLTALGANGTTTGVQSRPLPFLLAGTADVIGLHPGAVVRRYPVPGTVDHESDRCPYVELADASLPWRYTPAPAPGASSPALHPWLVLVVGEESELSVADGIATLATSVQTGVQAVGTPSSAYRFAHVQVDGAGHRTARVLCARPLDAGTDYIAALVPAFDAHGAPSWTRGAFTPPCPLAASRTSPPGCDPATRRRTPGTRRCTTHGWPTPRRSRCSAPSSPCRRPDR